MAIDNGNILSSTNTKKSLSFTTKGKVGADGSTVLKTDYRTNLTITTPAPLIWDNSVDTYKRSVSQSNPIRAAITAFDSNSGKYTVEYTWNKHNNPDPAYYTGSLTVKPENANNISVNSGTKNIFATGITYNAASNLTIERYSPVTLAGTIPGDSSSNQGGSISDNEFYHQIEETTFDDDDFLLTQTTHIYGPAQLAGSVNDLSGVLTLASDSSWLTFDNGTTNEEYTFDNNGNKFPAITVNASANTPNAKYGTASASLDYSPKLNIDSSSTKQTITLSGLEKVTDADNTQAETPERTAKITYSFHINNYQGKTADGVAIANLTPEDITNESFTITQSGGNVAVPNPDITYSLTYKSADYKVSGDDFVPTRTGNDTFTVNFGDIDGAEGTVSGSVNADFPDSFEVYGGTYNVTFNGLNITNPVNYNSRDIKFTAYGRIDYVDEVNNSTVGISNHTYTTSKEITIHQLAHHHDMPQAEIKWYIDSAKTNTAPYGKSKPTLSIGTNPMSLGSSSKTISLIASSNEAESQSGGVTGDLDVYPDRTSVSHYGGTVFITADPVNMTFNNATIPATDSAYFRVRGYSTSNTRGDDNISTVAENSFEHDFSNAIPGSGNLVYNKLIYIKGQKEINNGAASLNVSFTSTGGSTVSPSSLTFNSPTNSKQTSWSIPGASLPSTSLTYEMASDNESVTISMSGSNLGDKSFTCTYNYNGKSNSFSVTRQGNRQVIETSLNVSGDLDYLNSGSISFPMTYTAWVYDTYTFSGWSFNNATRETIVNLLFWDATNNQLYFDSTGAESTKSSTLKIDTLYGDDPNKSVTFTLKGEKDDSDESGITNYEKTWVVPIPVTTTGIDTPTLEVTTEGYEKYFSYTWDSDTLKFTGTFKAVSATGSSLTINIPDYNTNGWDKYFTVNYSGASGGDEARTVKAVAACGGHSATLTCSRDAVTISASSSTVISFNVINNNPDFVTLSCPTTTVDPNKTATITPVATLKDLTSISLDKFDNYISDFVGQGSGKTLDTITTDITTKQDSTGYPQLGAFDTGTYHFYTGFKNSGIPSSIILTKALSGQVSCNQDASKVSNYNYTVSKSVDNIISNSNPEYKWSITNNSGSGFLSIDNNGVLTLNNSNYNVTNESGVDETVTCTVTFGSPAKEYFGKDTLSITGTLHIDGKHYVNIPWSDSSPTTPDSGDSGDSGDTGGSTGGGTTQTTPTNYKSYINVVTQNNLYYLKNTSFSDNLSVTYSVEYYIGKDTNGKNSLSKPETNTATINANSSFNTFITPIPRIINDKDLVLDKNYGKIAIIDVVKV